MYNFLTSNFNTTDSQKIRQLILLNLLALAAAISSIFFAYFNFYITGTTHIAFMNILAVMLSILVFLDLRFNKNFERASKIAILGVTSFFLLFVYYNKNDSYGLFWVPLVPIFIIGLIGTKKSAPYLVPYFFIIFSLAYTGIGEWHNGQWDFIGFIRFVFSSLLMTLSVIMMDLALMQSYKNLERLSSVDALTEIYNRRTIQEKVAIEMQRAKRYEKDLAIILFDIDNFKKINDTKGHNAGDRVLQKLSREIKNSLRSSDSFGRWGGEEFLLTLPEVNKEDALKIAEKIRLLIVGIPCQMSNTLSCSFGLTLFEKERDSTDSLIERVDNAMYNAKEMGKNRVELL
jgi:diguanylate cyclase (GGDEF)-like protein